MDLSEEDAVKHFEKELNDTSYFTVVFDKLSTFPFSYFDLSCKITYDTVKIHRCDACLFFFLVTDDHLLFGE